MKLIAFILMYMACMMSISVAVGTGVLAALRAFFKDIRFLAKDDE